MKPIRVIIADDHALMRAGLRYVMQHMPDLEVVGEAQDGRETISLVRDLAPDLVLTDITMQNLNGLEAAAQIRRDFPQTHVLILSAHLDEDYVSQALRAGASGYVLKSDAPAELEQAIQAALRDEIYLSPRISRQIVEQYIGRSKEKSSPLDQLTPRQREVLQLLAEGKSIKEIAGLLHLSPKTVETHKAHLIELLGIGDLPGLVRFAIRTGLVES